MALEKVLKIVSIGIIGIIAFTPIANAEYNDSIMLWVDEFKEWERRQNSTSPIDSLNNALTDMEIDYGSNGSTEQEELLQLSCNGDSEGLRRRHDRCSHRFRF